MTTVELALSDEDHEILQRRASEKGFKSVSEFLVDLARKDQHDAAREHFKDLIEEGLASPSFEVDDEWWERKKRELTEHKDVVERLLREGLESGEPIEMTDEWWANTKAELTARLQRLSSNDFEAR